MFKNSFWAPNSPRKVATLMIIGVMVVLHFTELTPVYDSTYLVFGWLPLQLAYDIGYHLLGVVVLYGLYRMSSGNDEPDDGHGSATANDEATNTTEVH